MGDRARHRVFAAFIAKRFPAARSVLAVADGKGQPAIELARYGLTVRIVEPKPRKFSRRFFSGGRHRGITFSRSRFDNVESEVNEDLVVGMHPDEATSEIVLAATKRRLPFAIVPCCLLGRHANHATDFDDWVRVLKRLARGHVQQSTLKFGGRNTVLYQQ